MSEGISIGGNVSIQISGPTVPPDGTVTAAKINSGNAGDGQVLTADGAGGAVWEAPANALIQGGNSFGEMAIIGTNDAFGLAIETGGVERARISANGNVGIQTTNPTAALHVPGSTTARASLRVPDGVAPTTPNDGDIWAVSGHLYARLGGVTKEFTLILSGTET